MTVSHQAPISVPTPHWQTWKTISLLVAASALAIVWYLVGEPEPAEV